MAAPYPARIARENAGLTLDQAAKRANVGKRYLSDCERSGRFSYGLARRLARLYAAPLESFLPVVCREPKALGVRQSRAAGAARN